MNGSIDALKYTESTDSLLYCRSVLNFLLRSSNISDQDACALLEQVDAASLNIEDDTKTTNVEYQRCKLIATVYSIILSKLLDNGYDKFQVKVTAITERLASALDPSKLTSKTVMSAKKKLAIICLIHIFAKFDGFLNNYKITLLNNSYKHVKKLTAQSEITDYNYLNCLLQLIGTVCNSNPPLDAKIFNRLFKLYKQFSAKNKTYTIAKESFTFPVMTIIYANNILDSLLRSPFYISSITTKKTQQIPLHYLNSISPYLTYLISITDTRFKDLALSASKNITNLLTFNYINYAVDLDETRVFNFTISYLWGQYLQYDSKKVKVAVLEVLVQFLSTINLMYETGIAAISKNFVSMKSFDIISLTTSKIFGDAEEAGGSTKAINSTSKFSNSSLVLQHLKYFYSHMLKEIKSDVNKLIVLQHLYDEVIDPSATENSYKVISLISLSQLIIQDLDQYILTQAMSKMKQNLLTLSTNKNSYIRIYAIQTLSKLDVDSDSIVATVFRELHSVLSEINKGDNEDTFISSHSKSLLITSIISTTKSPIASDSMLSILSLANNNLKKFNSNIAINSLINSNDFSSLSNHNYEKQISSWVLMMGLFNYYQNTKNSFLLNNNQLLAIWKTLLAHNIPSTFLKVENRNLVHCFEMVKFFEIKNYSLSCLICFIDYAISLNAMPLDFSKHLTPLLTKCYSFVSGVEQSLIDLSTSCIIPDQLFKTLKIQKLRILSNFMKLLPHIVNMTDEINISTDMLLNIVRNFNDHRLYNKKADYSPKLKDSTYSVYEAQDGTAAGLTSKLNLFTVDEILFKNSKESSTSNDDLEIDYLSNSTSFVTESRFVKSTLTPASQWDELHASLYQPIQSSLMNDYLFPIFANSTNYSSRMEEAVPVETAVVDLSIELFQFVFPYLSLKIQQSVVEHIRLAIMGRVEETKARSEELNNSDRQKAVVANSSVAIHGMLFHAHSTMILHLKLSRMIVNMLLDLFKSITTEDLIVINLNAESVGLCLAVMEDEPLKQVSEVTAYFVNKIVVDNDPYSRVFSCLALANICRFNSKHTNAANVIDIFLKLAIDPHPVVHHWALESLLLALDKLSNIGSTSTLFDQIFKLMEQIITNDDFGVHTKSAISANLNLSFQGCDKNLLIVKIARVTTKILGPALSASNQRNNLRSIILEVLSLASCNFELISREMIVLLDELRMFDKTLIEEQIYQKFLRFLYINNMKSGVYNHNLAASPMLDDIIDVRVTSTEIFPMNSSDQLLRLSVDSLHRIVKVTTDAEALYNTFTVDLQNILWMLLETNNEQVYEIFQLWMELDFSGSDNDELKAGWFDQLMQRHNSTEKELYGPLNQMFKRKLDSNASLFINKMKMLASVNTNKQSSSSSTSSSQQKQKQEAQPKQESRLFGSKRKSNDRAEEDDIDSDGSEEANAMAAEQESLDNDEGVTENELARESTTAKTEVFAAVGGASQKISEDEPVSWQFKLKILRLLIQMLTYVPKDQFLFKYLMTKLSDLVRISFIASTSFISELKFTGLKLLGLILQNYSSVRDPLYENLSILDQQQAQIISAILPAFAKGASIDLLCEGFNITGILVGSNITPLGRLQRVMKILVTALHDASKLKANKKPDMVLKVSEVEIKSSKEQDRVTLAVLHSFAIMKSYCKDADEELQQLLNDHLKMLTSLWIYTLKQSSIVKYGEEFVEKDELPFEMYSKYWQDIMTAVSSVMRDDSELIEEILGEELNNFFFTIFAQCVEVLFKRPQDDALIILKNAMALKSSSKVVYHELIFEEIVDLFDKLLLNSTVKQKAIMMDIISELYIAYFDNQLASGKDEQDVSADLDKLFELLRLVVGGMSQILPFIKDKQLQVEKIQPMGQANLQIIKKAFIVLMTMISKLPFVIQLDLYSCILFMFQMIYELGNDDLIEITLPHLKKILTDVKGHPEIVNSFMIETLPHLRQSNSTNALLSYMIIVGCVDNNLILQQSDAEHITELLIKFLQKEEKAALATRSLKTLMIQTGKNVNTTIILNQLLPELVRLVIEKRLEEPRIIIELLMMFIKNHKLSSDDKNKVGLAQLMLIVPILIWFSSIDRNYVTQKFMDLVQLDSEIFREFVTDKATNEERTTIQFLLTDTQNSGVDKMTDQQEAEKQHISLKMFGADE